MFVEVLGYEMTFMIHIFAKLAHTLNNKERSSLSIIILNFFVDANAHNVTSLMLVYIALTTKVIDLDSYNRFPMTSTMSLCLALSKIL